MPKKMPKKWVEAAKFLQPAGDKMVKARWVNTYGYDQNGLWLDMTALGEKMFKKMWSCQKELAKYDFDLGSDDLKALTVFVKLTAKRFGWK